MRFWIIIAAVLSIGAAAAQTVAPSPTPASPQATGAQTPAPGMAAEAPVASIDKGDSAVERPIVCYSAREASDRVARLRLFNPLIAMQSNARRLRAEPLRSRLCRSAGRLVYELSLIRRDGKVLRLYLNAQNGRPMASPRN